MLKRMLRFINVGIKVRLYMEIITLVTKQLAVDVLPVNVSCFGLFMCASRVNHADGH